MAAAEEAGLLRFYVESALGDREVLVDSVRTEPLSTTTIASRTRVDVAGSMVAQGISPTPSTGRPVLHINKHIITSNGYLVVAHKSDAADILDSDDALAKCNISIVARDLTKVGTPQEFRLRQLSKADRDQTRVTDDPTLSTSSFVDVYAFKVPTGQEWMMHGEHELFLADDTA